MNTVGESRFFDKFEIIDTLYTDDTQSVYVCNPIGLDMDKSFLVNEYKDVETIEEIKDSFLYSKDVLKYTGVTEIDNKFYAVFPMPVGTPLDEYISRHNLTIADKMYFTDGILKKFIEIDSLDNALQLALCNLDNISVQNRRFFQFNNKFILHKENLKPNSNDIIKKLGYIFLCIFSNKADADIDKDKQNLPPAILPIVTKTIDGGYDSLGKIYADFRNTLLYSTFVESGSLDNQIRNKMVKAHKKRKTAAPRAIAFLLILAALVTGSYWLMKNKGIFTAPGNGIGVINKKGNPPIAEFSISINKVYKDDEVKFIDKSIASNPGDLIETRLWTIEKDGTVVMNSEKEYIVYSFDETGEYRISLIAQDSRGVHSRPYTHSITVLEKPEFPDSDPDLKIDNAFDRK